MKCKNGHKYCYECLNKWHLNSTCKEIKEILEYKGKKILKKCPKCSIYTEKNEGCNHMTCSNCKFQWCWLCEKEYNYNHYSQGECNGLQFIRANSLTEAKNINLNNINNQNVNNNRNENGSCCHCDCSNCCESNILYQCEDIIAQYIVSDYSKNRCRSFIVAVLLHLFFGFFINSLKIISIANESGYSKRLVYRYLCDMTSFCLFICFQLFYVLLFIPILLISIFKCDCIVFLFFPSIIDIVDTD